MNRSSPDIQILLIGSVNLLAAWPIVSALMAEAETGASRAAVQRNPEMRVARRLIREVTGQGRYRVWTAAVWKKGAHDLSLRALRLVAVGLPIPPPHSRQGRSCTTAGQ